MSEGEIERLRAKYLREFARHPYMELDTELLERVKKLHLPAKEEALLTQLVFSSEFEKFGAGTKVLDEFEAFWRDENSIEQLKLRLQSDFPGPFIVVEHELVARVKKYHLPEEEEGLLLQLVAFAEEETPGAGKKLLNEYDTLTDE